MVRPTICEKSSTGGESYASALAWAIGAGWRLPTHAAVGCARIPLVNPWLLTAPAALAGVTGLTIYGAVHPRAQLFGPTIRYTSSPRQLAITFDDGPNPSITPQFLDLLDRYQARATFFLIGRYARECPHLVREIS